MDNNCVLIEVLNEYRDSDMLTFFLNLKGKINREENKYQILLDMKGFFISNSFKSYLIDFLRSNSEKIESLAACGVGKGVRKVILQSIDFPIYIADDREDALDWFQN